ncbi:MAG: CAP domain-containing protein [Patescibacteria group bacterium]
MNRKTIILITLFVVVGATLFFYKDYFFDLSPKLSDIGKTAEILVGDIKKEISNPPPLRMIRESERSYLTRAGTIKFTNMQRVNNGGLALLLENSQLNAVASRKVQDMFNRQYFEHVSPDGKNVGDLVDGVGYEYIAVGENLALGNYKDDQELVQAWMDSPGHRANILSSKFKEIGVAVGKGMFEGKETWLAVQTFALPLDFCPQADDSLKSQISWLELQVAELKVKADLLLDELDLYKKRGDKDGYNKKVEEYNAVVKQINDLVAQIKTAVIKYNDQVKMFNACIAES